MFDFKDSLALRASQKEQQQNYVESKREEFDYVVEEFKTTYLKWYKQCEGLNVLNNVDCFLRDISFKLITNNSLSKYYSNEANVKVELFDKDVNTQETLPFKFGIVGIYFLGHTTFLKLLGDTIEDTTDPMPF